MERVYRVIVFRLVPDSDYQLATPGLNNQSPTDARHPSRIIRNGDLFSTYKDNRESERERYISRQVNYFCFSM